MAYLRGTRDYLKAFFTSTGDRAGAATQLARHLAVKDVALYERMAMPYIRPDGYINVSDLNAQQAWYLSQGLVQQAIPLEQAVDNSFVDFALRALGPYNP